MSIFRNKQLAMLIAAAGIGACALLADTAAAAPSRNAAVFPVCYNPANGALSARRKCRRGETVVNAANFYFLLPPPSPFSGVSSGDTMSGVVGGVFPATIAATQLAATASFPAPGTVNLASSDVIVATSAVVSAVCSPVSNCLASEETDVNSVCTGSAGAPTAPAGKVCIYPTSVVNASSIKGLAVPNAAASVNGGNRGFELSWLGNSGTAEASSVVGVWAYTAP